MKLRNMNKTSRDVRSKNSQVIPNGLISERRLLANAFQVQITAFYNFLFERR
jgi:hypothetical protein